MIREDLSNIGKEVVVMMFKTGFVVFMVGGAVNIPGHEFLILGIGTAMMAISTIIEKVRTK